MGNLVENGKGANRAGNVRVTLELGPRGKRVVAVAPDWPGLERGAPSEEAAVERLLSYIPRYAPVAKLAGLEAEFATNTGNATNIANIGSRADAARNAADVHIVERYQGTGSTDFWGISFGFSDIDRGAISDEELERELALMRACWAFFDRVRASVSAEMQKGPRGGGRDRDRIVRHTLYSELDFTKKVGVLTPWEELLTDDRLKAHRDAYCNAIRAHHSHGKMARKWPLRYLIRHTAFHTLDHAWEMQDKDLTPR